MKKIIFFSSSLLLLLTSCGPSACECLSQFTANGLSFKSNGGLQYKSTVSPSLVRKCYDKFGESVSPGRGAQEQMVRILKPKCK